MSFPPPILLSSAAKERCIANIKEAPTLVQSCEESKVTAAVLVPLCIDNGEVCLLYTLRSSKLSSHSGEVSFPGGKMDNNETVYETALRETEEEIGVNPDDVDIWTKMPLVRARNRSTVIAPVVGFIRNFDVNKLKRNPDEVDEVFTVPMSALCNIEMHGHTDHVTFIMPVYLYKKYTIWGITAMMTHFFLQSFLPDHSYTNDFMRKRYKFNELKRSSKS